jgi:hypothetical protein
MVFTSLVTVPLVQASPQRDLPLEEPIPSDSEGRVHLGPPSGEKGIWLPRDAQFVVDVADRVNRQVGPPFPRKPMSADVPFQPWARALYDFRLLNEFEPHARCKPSGGARQFFTPYGVEFVDVPELKVIYIMDIGGPHTYRTVYMDGRDHPADLAPTYYGHSVGRWEDGTLVIDTVGFNERFWMDREGSPHTDQLHVVERVKRTSLGWAEYGITIDDPGAYTEPWSTGVYLVWRPETEIFEYICQDNNFANILMIGVESEVDRNSRIVP